MKGKLILTFIIMATLSTQIVYAHPGGYVLEGDYPSDEWLIENAIHEVKEAHPKHTHTHFTGVITTGWHTHPYLDAPLHKHVRLTASFGYKNLGTVRWEGRSYADGGIFTFQYSNHNPDSVPKIYSKIVHLGPTQHWDGSKWLTNSPEIIRNTGDSKCSVMVLGSGGYTRTIGLRAGYSLVVYPPIGVDITFSIS